MYKCLLKKITIPLIICIGLVSCSENHRKKISFYHWKLKVEEQTSHELLEKLEPENIYLHIMDVDYNFNTKTPTPQAQLQISVNDNILQQNIIPVVFIQNRVMSESDSSQLKLLAEKLITTRQEFLTHHNIPDHAELQIDCDWLQSHKDKYFYFLNAIKELKPDIILSVTLRLYPYKYRLTMGVPPVDYAVLMCYNMDDIKKIETPQSILNSDILKQYLTNKNYPLKIKVALPIFGWWVWFSNNSYNNILYLKDDFKNKDFLNQVSENKFQLLIDTNINNQYLRKGDYIRNEFPTIQELNKSIETIESYLNFDEIIYYHWDNQLINQYEKIFIQ